MGHEKDWHLLNWYCPSLCKVKSFLLWRQFPRSPNLSICSFVYNLQQSDPRFHFRTNIFEIIMKTVIVQVFFTSNQDVGSCETFSECKMPWKFWSSMYWLIHDKCISFAHICKIATRKKSCYQQKGKKLQKIYLCTLVEATKIGNKKMKKMSTKRVNCNKSWNHDIIAFVLTKYFSPFQKRSDEGCSTDLVLYDIWHPASH